MRLRQYAYFALKSEAVSASEMTAWLGIEPDEVGVRGSRQTDPFVRPVCHVWKIVCREPNLTVDEQIEHILDRLLPAADRIGGLAAEPGRDHERTISSVLQVVRYFGDEDEDSTTTLEQESPEQRNLFGWHVDARVLDFLRRTHAELDVDEYGD
ncbi:DUF4279 domain-containing protein [Catellatospora bangladeshensis]|uniref:DUF4279 domain-containing protein n=1 Tax=Catellatospora bangladeshensis TaxID=310355 RepID=A0A8J3JJX7_9ACTN|nr:DUF4279 domain-containing protein [Catellatospora bangladeshensis]GIF82073.1 hypothetical protein Cba03nite_34220 [Catellatospora bangladeshensis]